MKPETAPLPAKPSLARHLPGVLKMSNIEGYKRLCQLSAMCSDGPDSDLVSALLAEFLLIRGLSVRLTGQKYRGCEISELRRGDKVIASFSVAVG